MPISGTWVEIDVLDEPRIEGFLKYTLERKLETLAIPQIGHDLIVVTETGWGERRFYNLGRVNMVAVDGQREFSVTTELLDQAENLRDPFKVTLNPNVNCKR